MKALFSFLSCLIMLALFTRCADDELDGPSDGLPDKGLVVRLSTGGGLETKTPLNSTGAYHHVKEVWAVLYKWNEKTSTTDPTNNENYEFITAEKLPWDPYGAKDYAVVNRPNIEEFYATPGDPESLKEDEYNAALEAYLKNMEETYGGSYGNGNIQQKDFELHSDENGTLLDAGIYRVLCIGLDDVSKTLYGLRIDENNLSDIFADGKTLADAVATITDIKQAFEGELFAGWAEFQFEPDNLNIVEVEMKRRVAGVLCYVTDIPRVITGIDGDQLVKGIRLVLNTQANNQVHLCRPVQPYEENNGNKTYTDFGDFVGDGGYQFADPTVLATYDLSAYVTTDDPTQMDKGETFNEEIPVLTGDVETKPGSLLMGAYLLPVKAPTSGATLSVQLLGWDDDKTDVDLTDPTATKILATFNATRSGVEGGDVTSYDILPNYIYHIGNKPEPDGTDKDEPVSLLGQKITVTPEPWKGQDVINVEYPSVPIANSIELVDQNGKKYLDSHYFDCIGIDDQDYMFTNDDGELVYSYSKNDQRIRLKVNPSLMKNKWKIIIYGVDADENLFLNPDMLYIKDDVKDIYATDYTCTWEERQQTTYLDLLMTSYAVEGGPDTRKVMIRIESYADETSEDPNFVDDIYVTQYNAIIVDANGGKRGFCHYDYGEEFGSAIEQHWGYNFMMSTVISQNLNWEGDTNYKTAKDRAGTDPDRDRYKSFYGGSAIYNCGRPFIAVSNGKKQTVDKIWYLPARYELQEFLDVYKDKKEHNYWSSTAYSTEKTYYNKVKSDGSLLDSDHIDGGAHRVLDRSSGWAYMRQACVISK